MDWPVFICAGSVMLLLFKISSRSRLYILEILHKVWFFSTRWYFPGNWIVCFLIGAIGGIDSLAAGSIEAHPDRSRRTKRLVIRDSWFVVRDINFGAGERNRTALTSLGSWCSTDELRPQTCLPIRQAFFNKFYGTIFTAHCADILQ